MKKSYIKNEQFKENIEKIKNRRLKISKELRIGEKIKWIRKELNMNQTVFSKEIGLSKTYIAYLEQGKRIPSFEFIYYLSAKLNISMNWLFFDTGKMKQNLNINKVTVFTDGLKLMGMSLDDCYTVVWNFKNTPEWDRRFIRIKNSHMSNDDQKKLEQFITEKIIEIIRDNSDLQNTVNKEFIFSSESRIKSSDIDENFISAAIYYYFFKKGYIIRNPQINDEVNFKKLKPDFIVKDTNLNSLVEITNSIKDNIQISNKYKQLQNYKSKLKDNIECKLYIVSSETDIHKSVIQSFRSQNDTTDLIFLLVNNKGNIIEC